MVRISSIMVPSSTTFVVNLLLISMFGLPSPVTPQAQNAFDKFSDLDCDTFKSIVQEAKQGARYSSSIPLTVFVFNDTAYSRMPPYMIKDLYDNTSANNAGAEEYVSTFTISSALETSAFSASVPQRTNSVKNRKVFLNRKEIRAGNVASGLPGPTRYFVNGAMIIQPNIQAGQHILHVIDRVLPLPLEDNALEYVRGYNPDILVYRFYEEFMSKLANASQINNIENYQEQVQKPLSDLDTPMTFFLPSDQAIGNIPDEAKSRLVSNKELLLKIITLHIVPQEALYTSLVNHNDRYRTQNNSGSVIFRNNFDKEAVYVTGALAGGSTVTARINKANETVLNGVVHQIDELLGFVYKTVLEEISIDPVTQNFETLVNQARVDLKQALAASSGVFLFVPTNEALQALIPRYENYVNNQSLINMILEMSLLQTDQLVSLTDNNGGYESLETARSRYNNQLIKIYSAGNDMWVEGGYVKARVVKPDIGCTNGMVHQIDAVFGIPTRDLPWTIYCDDWLVSTMVQLRYVGLDSYMRDPTLLRNQACFNSRNAVRGAPVPNDGNYSNTIQFTQNSNNLKNNNSLNNDNNGLNNTLNSQVNQTMRLCGDTVHRCEFTFFVPNGTAIDNFVNTGLGERMQRDVRRFRWILRRLITFHEVIYLDRLAPGQQKVMQADNGDEVIIRTDSRSNIASGRRTAYIQYQQVRAEIIHSDIGATNGVMHIINRVLYVPEDLTRDVSGENLTRDVSEEDLTRDVSGEDLSRDVSEDDLPRDVSEEDLSRDVSEDDLPKDASTASRLTWASSVALVLAALLVSLVCR